MKNLSLINLIALGSGSVLFLGQTLTASAGSLDSIAPLINEQTYSIAAVDFDRLNFQAAWKEGLDYLQKSGDHSWFTGEVTNNLAQAQSATEKWVADFQKAGGRSLYALAYATDGLDYVLAVPLASTANRADLESVIESLGRQMPFGPREKQLRDNCLLLGHQDVLARIGSGKSAARSEFESALAAIPDTAVQWVLKPTGEQRRVIQEIMPILALDQQEIPTALLARSLIWMAVGIKASPHNSLHCTIQSTSSAGAQDLRKWVQTGLQWIGNQPQAQRVRSSLELLSNRLIPQVDQDRLSLHLDNATISNLFATVLLPLLSVNKAKADRIITLNHAKQILLACHMYQTDHNAWPEQLKALTGPKAYLENAEVLRSPRHPQLELGFDYLMPGKGHNQFPAAIHLVIHEHFDRWPADGLCVGFLDGHAEIMMDQKQFDQRLTETRERNARK